MEEAKVILIDKVGQLRKTMLDDDGNRVLYSAAEMLQSSNYEFPWLIDHLIPKVGISAIVGQSDIGKSTFSRQMCVAVGLGETTFLGRKLNTKAQNALYVSTEDDYNDLKKYLSEIHSSLSSKIPSVDFILSDEKVLQRVESYLKVEPTDLVIIDGYADVFNGNMNLSNEVRSFLGKFKRLASTYQCQIIFLHHTGKGKEKNEPDKNSVMNSAGFEQRMRVLIEFRIDSKDCDLRHICIVKANGLSRELKKTSIALHFKERMFSVASSGKELVEWGKEKILRDKPEISIAIELSESGITYDKISEKLISLGYKGVAKSTISDWIKKYRSIVQPTLGKPNIEPKSEEPPTFISL